MGGLKFPNNILKDYVIGREASITVVAELSS